ncbi:MAG: T9SS type A sorting domain-containing protein [Bacteroidales bacterium]
MLTCGYFTDSIVDFDPDSTMNNVSTNYDQSPFVAKYNLNYSPIQVKTMEPHSYLYFSSIYFVLPHQNGDFSLYGGFEGDSTNLSLNSNSPYYIEGSPDHYNLFIARYDSMTNIKFGKSITGTGSKYMNPNSAIVDKNDNLFISGSFTDQINFNYPNSPNYTFQTNASNLFTAVYSPSGKLLLASHFASALCWSSDWAIGLNNEIYFSGFFHNNIDVNPAQNNQTNLTESGKGLFVVKYNNIVGIGDNNFTKSKLKLFPNPVLAGSKINIPKDSQTNFRSVDVFTINGISIFSSKVDNHAFYLPEDIAPGFYLVNLYDKNNRCHTAKLVVQ